MPVNKNMHFDHKLFLPYTFPLLASLWCMTGVHMRLATRLYLQLLYGGLLAFDGGPELPVSGVCLSQLPLKSRHFRGHQRAAAAVLAAGAGRWRRSCS